MIAELNDIKCLTSICYRCESIFNIRKQLICGGITMLILDNAWQFINYNQILSAF